MCKFIENVIVKMNVLPKQVIVTPCESTCVKTIYTALFNRSLWYRATSTPTSATMLLNIPMMMQSDSRFFLCTRKLTSCQRLSNQSDSFWNMQQGVEGSIQLYANVVFHNNLI